MKGRVHVWRRTNDGTARNWISWCGAVLHEPGFAPPGKPEQEATVTPHFNLSKATCMHCLRRLRDCRLREAASASAQALEASELYESLKARRGRVKSGTDLGVKET